MSCTVVAIPLALQWVYGAILAGSLATTAAIKYNEQRSENELKNYGKESCNDIYVITDNQFLEKSFETPFMDKEILMKTLVEHGVRNIQENEYGKISGTCDTYELSFDKTEQDKPYYVVIKHLNTVNAEEKMQDLNSEYVVNVQEASYNSIIEKLQENNMEIEDEEVCEDNTIILTINLE